MMRVLVAALSLISSMVFAPIARAGEEFDRQAFESDMERMRAGANVPGVAIAIVKDGQILYAGGFGQRDVASGAAVTADTLFMIGSTTKAFAATAVGLLAERQADFSLSEPVRRYMPDFQLMDPVATSLTTPIDLLAHRTGLPRHDLVWYNSPLNRRQLFERLRYLGSDFTFRETFLYNNLMYLTAGLLVERRTGTTFEDFVETNLLAPLGMERTSFTLAALEADPDHALGYAIDGAGQPVVLPYVDLSNAAPAGVMNSSVNELSRWVLLQLQRGEFGGQRLVAASTLQTLQAPRVALGTTANSPGCFMCAPDIRYLTYGMGWLQMDYRGRTMIWHNGQIDGFKAFVSFVPEANVGVVVLANATHIDLPMIGALTAYDRVLGLPARDWLARGTQPLTVTPTCDGVGRPLGRDLASVTGVFDHPAYGRFTLAVVDGTLNASVRNLGATSVYEDDDGVLKMRGYPVGMCELMTTDDGAGRVQSVAIKLESLAPRIVFDRTGESFEDEGAVKRFVPPLRTLD